jgi:YihY family inner membrane protein
MDFLAPVRAFDRRQQRSRGLAVPAAVVRKYIDDQAGRLAALITFYGFVSLFPLLLVFVTVLGFVLQGNPHLEQSIKTSTLARMPVIGQELQVGELQGNVVSLVIGLLVAIWAGLRITDVTHEVLDLVWGVPRAKREGFLRTRLAGLAALGLLALLNIAASVASGLIAGGSHGTAVAIGGVLISLALNIGLFLTAFTLLSSHHASLREQMPGVIFAAVALEILQLAAGWYIGHQLKGSTGAYGVFGSVLALLSWIYLGAQATVFGAELNVVLARKLWPRSLLTPPASEEAKATA